MKIKDLRQGFTLVELLIVIALIAVLATALVATLNPIEQINKARDSRYKNDAAEVLAAIERYYATQQYYPWSENVWGDGNAPDPSTDMGLLGKMPGVGVCSGAAYNTENDGVECDPTTAELIDTDELKSSFANKSEFDTDVTDIDRLYLYKEGGTSSVYVCFIPKASSNQKLSANLIDLGMGADQAPQSFTEADQTAVDGATWTDRSNSLHICVPE